MFIIEYSLSDMAISWRKQFVCIFVLTLSSYCSDASHNGSNTAGCADNWVTYDGSCYLFGHHKLTFLDAAHFCRLYNSHLVHIDTSFENEFLKDHIRYMNNPSDYWWIGLTDEVIENDWRWLDTNTRPTFTDWYHGEPNNVGGVGEENCAELDIRRSKWNDISCTYSYRPICEIREGQSTTGIFG